MPIKSTAFRLVSAMLAVAVLTPATAACPYCSLSQGADTLMYIVGFLVIPYVVVAGTWIWMKRVLASEKEA
jgi:hypothetical protein